MIYLNIAVMLQSVVILVLLRQTRSNRKMIHELAKVSKELVEYIDKKTN